MTKNCLRCNKEFKTFPSRREKRRFCSLECRNTSYRHRSLTLEQREKMSIAHRKRWANGFKGSTGLHWRKTNEQLENKRGIKNPSWKGGITPINHKIRTSLKMEDWKRDCRQRDDFRCFDCDERGGQLQVDHLYPFSLFPRLRFDLDNGQTVCKNCHKERTNKFLSQLSQGLFQGRPLEEFGIKFNLYASTR
jgi:5-methylcytosine-specific restriction endonuclease McrA